MDLAALRAREVDGGVEGREVEAQPRAEVRCAHALQPLRLATRRKETSPTALPHAAPHASPLLTPSSTSLTCARAAGARLDCVRPLHGFFAYYVVVYE